VTLVLASARTEIADYLSAVIYVYETLIFVYVLMSWVFASGVRFAYNRWFDGVWRFVRDVTVPYLNPFRRVLPGMAGMFSPILAIIVLQLVNSIVVRHLIHG
jgi:uncharacterized protein YggT (Ycf19 family)